MIIIDEDIMNELKTMEDLDRAILEKDTDEVEYLLKEYPDENAANCVIMSETGTNDQPLTIFWLDWFAERGILPNDYAWSFIYDTECRMIPSLRVDLTTIKTWLTNHNIPGKHLFDWVPQ